MENKIDDNRDYCLICGKEIPPGPDCCSSECEEKFRIEVEIEATKRDSSVTLENKQE